MGVPKKVEFNKLKDWDSPKLLGVLPGSKLCTTFLNLAKNDEIMSKNNLQETQRNRNATATANFVNLIRTSTVHVHVHVYQTLEKTVEYVFAISITITCKMYKDVKRSF